MYKIRMCCSMNHPRIAEEAERQKYYSFQPFGES